MKIDSSISVLLVDQNPEFAALVRVQLSKNTGVNFLLTIARSGMEAMERLRESPDTDVVLIDPSLPDMDGFSLFKSMKEMGIDRPTVFVAARRELAGVIEAMKLGAKDFLIKDELFGNLLPITLKTIAEKRRLSVEQMTIEISQKRLEAMREIILDVVDKITIPLKKMDELTVELEKCELPEAADKYVKIIKDNLVRIESKKEKLTNLKEDRTVKYIRDITMIDLS